MSSYDYPTFSNDIYDEELLQTNGSGFKFASKTTHLKTCLLFTFVIFLAGTVLFAGLGVGSYFLINEYVVKPATHKNVILIPDGYGPSAVTMAREVSGKVNFALDNSLVGTARTSSINSWVTDSAAAATAYASCIKTINNVVGLNRHQRPVITALEAAKKKGLKTGIVVTSRVTHATPAAFSSHVRHRDMEFDIASQQITKKIDIILGGGSNMFLPKSKGGKREDNRDLIVEARELHGYNYIDSVADFRRVTTLPLLGLFSKDHLDYEADRNPLQQPSLTDMTKKAIKLLQDAVDADPKSTGFFLLIEGSRIDHGNHDNDPVAAAGDAIHYDETWKVAQQFTIEHGNTALVSVADHETGGIVLGGPIPTNVSYGWYPEYIAGSVHTAAFVIDEIIKGKDIKQAILENYKVPASNEVAAKVRELIDNNQLWDASKWVSKPVADKANLKYAHNGHSGVDVNIYAAGAIKEQFFGNLENTQICERLTSFLGLNMTDSSVPGFETEKEPILKF
eukprot:gene3785-6946_t